MSRVGVILSGCGVFDGAEIQEASALLIALAQRNIEYRCMAPDVDLQVINHISGKPTGETRNVLVESARIARGEIDDLKNVKGTDYDAFFLPGGFGAAKNLCTFAADGADCAVNPEVQRVLEEAQNTGKPIGFICIAPALGARVFGSRGVKVTIGHDKGTADAVCKTGAVHIEQDATGIVADDDLRIASTPAYMEAKNPAEVFEGISNLVDHIVGQLS